MRDESKLKIPEVKRITCNNVLMACTKTVSSGVLILVRDRLRIEMLSDSIAFYRVGNMGRLDYRIIMELCRNEISKV